MSKPTKALIEQHAQQMARAAFDEHNQKTKNTHNDPQALVQNIAIKFALLHQYLINSVDSFKIPKTKSPERIFSQLVRHCFVKYPIAPRWFEAIAPLKNYALKDLDPKSLKAACGTVCAHPDGTLPIFLTLASGGSVHKKHFAKYLTKKETHAFVTCPHQDYTLDAALVYAIAKCAGAPDGTAARLARSRLREHLNITQPYWIENIRFFAKDVPESIAKINDICDYLRAQKAQDANFTIVGRGYTSKTLERRTKDWHYELARSKSFGEHYWNHCMLPDHTIETPSLYHNNAKDVWEFTQIKSSQELAKEGTAMHHCVSSYVHYCRNGKTAIWSLKCNGARKLTIELSLPSNTGSYEMNIVQVRGFANRVATAQERSVVQTWAQTFDLNMSSKYLFRY